MLRRIAEGEWLAGQALPSEWDLAAEMAVSQGTVRKALNDLVAEGVLFRQQGKGTFVAEGDSDWGKSLLVSPGLFDAAPERLSLELLGVSRAHASDDMARALTVRRTAPLVRVRQLWRLGGEAVAIDDAYLPQEQFDDLDARWLRQSGGGVYATLSRHYGVRVRCVQQQVRAVVLPREEAGMLGVSPDVPVLSLLRLTAGMDGVPVEWRQRFCLTQFLAYTL